MIRPSQDADAPYVDGVIHGDGLTSLQFRRTKARSPSRRRWRSRAPTSSSSNARAAPTSSRPPSTAIPSPSSRLSDVSLGDEVLVGLALCSHNPDVMERAIFRDVRIIKPAKDTFVPYRDFIGSVLEILDVGTGHRQIIHSSAQPFEAPNWTPDGSALIYNRSGRGGRWGGLYRFDLATRQATLIDTGVANRNNNDHVLSFDGSMLGLSDQSQASGRPLHRLHRAGRRRHAEADHDAVAVVPAQLVAGRQGSDLHRRAEQRVRHLPHPRRRQRARGQLTNSQGLDDGPEYTPDGKYIYFNSARTGTMQVWRMKPDGTDQEQVTNDEYNNWFPHISPDGKWIAIISFQKDVRRPIIPTTSGLPAADARRRRRAEGDRVCLRRPGHDQRAVWSPDSTMIAFVSNTDMAAPAPVAGRSASRPHVRPTRTADRRPRRRAAPSCWPATRSSIDGRRSPRTSRLHRRQSRHRFAADVGPAPFQPIGSSCPTNPG
jgi:hypothetical protein